MKFFQLMSHFNLSLTLKAKFFGIWKNYAPSPTKSIKELSETPDCYAEIVPL